MIPLDDIIIVIKFVTIYTILFKKTTNSAVLWEIHVTMESQYIQDNRNIHRGTVEIRNKGSIKSRQRISWDAPE